MDFATENEKLLRCFTWARETALSYVTEDAAGGPCYEAALPGRRAYCMRDMSHQAKGAHYLGLDRHNKNMLRHFAENISAARDYCTFWEICFDGTPCPADYISDEKFWYNLPANFDILRTCDELYELTADPYYLSAAEIVAFARLSMNEYIERWDRDKDGFVDRLDIDDVRGIGSYDEADKFGYTVALDTFTLQARAYRAAQKMFNYIKDDAAAEKMSQKADAMFAVFHELWWLKEERKLAQLQRKDGTRGGEFSVLRSAIPIRDGLLAPAFWEDEVKDLLLNEKKLNLEDRTYLPEVLFMTGHKADALTLLCEISSENCARREYPEVSFTVIGDLISGYMGLTPLASETGIVTKFGGIDGETAALSDVPVFSGVIDLKHKGMNVTELTNRTGKSILWTARFDDGEKNISLANGETAVLTAK